MYEWPYNRALAANLLYLTGVRFDQINEQEVAKFEESLASDYLSNITEFWNYVTEICLLGGDYGLRILAAFNNAYYDKKIIVQRKRKVPCINQLHRQREKITIKHCEKYFTLLREGFSPIEFI